MNQMTHVGLALTKAIAMARISTLIPSIADPCASPVKGALLGSILPGVHLIGIVSALDEALAEYIDANGVAWPKNKKPNLSNRIELVANVVPRIKAKELHLIRELRNSVAHDTSSAVATPLTWKTLNEAIGTVASAFIELGFLSAMPNIEAYFFREPTLYLEALGPNGEIVRHHFRVGAKMDGVPFLEYSTDVSYGPAGS